MKIRLSMAVALGAALAVTIGASNASAQAKPTRTARSSTRIPVSKEPPAPAFNADSAARADSIARAAAMERARQDSIANAERMRQDSIAAAERA